MTLPTPQLNKSFTKGLNQEEVRKLEDLFSRSRPFVRKINERVYKDLCQMRRTLESSSTKQDIEIRELIGMIKGMRMVLNYTISDKEIPEYTTSID